MKKKINKKNVYAGIITGIISLLVILLVDAIRVKGGLSARFEDDTYFFVYPYLAICLGFAGYLFSKVYKEQKALFLSNYQPQTIEEKNFLVKILNLKPHAISLIM